MNGDSRQGVVGAAVDLAGTATLIGGAAYGLDKALMSKTATNMMNKTDGEYDSMFGGVIEKYRDKKTSIKNEMDSIKNEMDRIKAEQEAKNQKATDEIKSKKTANQNKNQNQSQSQGQSQNQSQSQGQGQGQSQNQSQNQSQSQGKKTNTSETVQSEKVSDMIKKTKNKRKGEVNYNLNKINNLTREEEAAKEAFNKKRKEMVKRGKLNDQESIDSLVELKHQKESAKKSTKRAKELFDFNEAGYKNKIGGRVSSAKNNVGKQKKMVVKAIRKAIGK